MLKYFYIFYLSGSLIVLDAALNNLWVIIAALFVFIMTMAVGFLEVGEFGVKFDRALLKTLIITCSAIFFMAFLGFNDAFAPTISGIIGNPVYNGIFLGGFNPNVAGILGGVWWSMTSTYFGTGLTTTTYFLFETAFAAVTLALVGLVVLRKMRMSAFFLYSIAYFLLIWAIPAAWIWNPTGWLARMGMVDFAGGLVVHGAAGAAGLGIMLRIWQEEKKKGMKTSPQVSINANSGWLTLGLLLLWVGWFGFNPGSVLQFNSEALVVVITTFLAAAAACGSTLVFTKFMLKRSPTLIDGVNGVLMGLIVITPVAGFVGIASAAILGLLGGPIFVWGESFFPKFKWFTDPAGLLAGHTVGGIFGVLMIAVFAQKAFAAGSGFPSLPNGLLFGGGMAALRQMGVEILGVVVCMLAVFVLSYLTCYAIAKLMGGSITRKEYKAAE
ncbi:MAG: ammonium transporter [Candidatus Micrarchaeota archaeon]|nr:ammonium transporter [Candidatus Micrarchaeota archaeon]MDE1864168.1 ammonium transporter [Candidatus Micrarchaeota archaeon]